MIDRSPDTTLALITTAFITFGTGFALGIYSIRGYLFVDPEGELIKERRRNLQDPIESEESDVDEDDSLLDHAPNWANAAAADRKQGLKQAAPLKVKDNGEECKLVLVVRTDLGMTKGKQSFFFQRLLAFISLFLCVLDQTDLLFSLVGKIAAQCGHATLACYKSLAKHAPGSPERSILSRWEKLGQAKIAVQVKSQEEIMELRKKAKSLGITADIVQDAGRTQIAAGSITVLGVGPAPRSLVDQITGGLKLL